MYMQDGGRVKIRGTEDCAPTRKAALTHEARACKSKSAKVESSQQLERIK